MGTILQQTGPTQCPRRQRANGASWSEHRPGFESTDARMLQKKSQHPQTTEDSTQKSLTKRRHRSTNRMLRDGFQETSKSISPVQPPSDQVRSSVTCNRKKKKNTDYKSTRHTAAFPCHQPLLDVSVPHISKLGECSDNRVDSDTDLSECEKLSDLPCAGPPPLLELRPEVISLEEPPTQTRHKHKYKYEFPDFLPPPFNSWSLNQLAYFYNMEGCEGSRTRPTGPLERYLERLIQLEWYQIKTRQENNETSQAELLTTNHKALQSTSARLSTPKCILQCQRAFPLTVLSSVPSHCAYIVCTTRNMFCSCRSSGIHANPSRLSPTQERRQPSLLPKRSYSESRASSLNTSDKFSNPVKNQGHLKQMQAAGNLRTSVQTMSNIVPSTTANDQGPIWKDNFVNSSTGVRSSSVFTKGNPERQPMFSEKRRTRSECRKIHSEKRAQQEIKPDAVNAIMDNLTASKPVNRPTRSKQVEFVT